MTTMHRYVEADLTMKKAALARLQEPGLESARYQPSDALMQFLQNLELCRGTIAPIPSSIGVGATTLHNCELYIAAKSGH